MVVAPTTPSAARRALLLAASALWFGDVAAQADREMATESSAFQDLRHQLDTGFADVRGLVVLRQGQQLFEYQRNGDPDTLHDVQSVAKSGLSALGQLFLQDGRWCERQLIPTDCVRAAAIRILCSA